MAIKKEVTAMTPEEAQLFGTAMQKLKLTTASDFVPPAYKDPFLVEQLKKPTWSVNKYEESGLAKFLKAYPEKDPSTITEKEMIKFGLGEQGIIDFNLTPQEQALIAKVYKYPALGFQEDLAPYADIVSKFKDTGEFPFQFGETGKTYDTITGQIYDEQGKPIAGAFGGQEKQYPQEGAMKIAGGSAASSDELVWVQKGPNQLQVKKSVADQMVASGQATMTAAPAIPKALPKAGQLLKPSDIAMGTTLKESDIARTTGINIYKRDLAKEQSMMPLYAKTYGEPKTDEDWLKFHDYVYEGKAPGSAVTSFLPEIPANLSADVIDKGMKAGSALSAAETAQTANITAIIDNLATTTLSGLDKALYNLQTTLQNKAAADLALAEKEKTTAKIGFESYAIIGKTNEQKLKDLTEEYQIKQKSDKLTSIKLEIEKLKESLNLGLLQEGERVAPMGYIGRSQARLQNQAAAQIGALSAIGAVYDDDYDRAWNLAGAFLDAFQADTAQKINAYQYLIGLADKDVVTLKADEKEAIDNKITLLQNEQKEVKANVQKTTELILKYPNAAVKGKVALTDSYEKAIEKMTPYLNLDEEIKTVFETAGGQNWMITYDTKGKIVKKESLGSAYKAGTANTTEENYKIQLLEQKDAGMTYEEAIKNWSPYISISYIADIYGEQTSKFEQQNEFTNNLISLKNAGYNSKNAWEYLKNALGELNEDELKIFKQVFGNFWGSKPGWG